VAKYRRMVLGEHFISAAGLREGKVSSEFATAMNLHL
jgi:hypothetical protein